MIAGVPKELYPGERRVSLSPGAIPVLAKAGFNVLVERGAGEEAGFADTVYEEKGARLAGSRAEVVGAADYLLHVRDPGALDFRPGQTVIGTFDALGRAARLREAASSGATIFSLDLMPRITRAQAMDVLSSQAVIAGYKAVLLAAERLPKMFPMLMTAAGTVSPAHVFVIGAGVAGLQAIATARRLGAVVEAYDVRPAVREQVESVGAKFVELPLETAAAEGAGGYARAQDDEFYRRQRELMARVVAGNDVVISTAAVPGRPAPVLITAEMVDGMARGSVIVDLAAERGGNCELTRPNEIVVQNGVTILGPLNLPAAVPYHASQMYARNMTNFLVHLATVGGDGDDEIVRETLVARGGQLLNPRVMAS